MTGEVSSRGVVLPGEVSRVGLLLPEGLSFDEWESVGKTLKSIEQSIMWWLGDWLRYGDKRYGEMYEQASEITDYNYGTLRNAKWVAESFPELSRRRDNLSFGHHQVAASLSFDVDDFLDDCVRQGWSIAEARREVNRRKNTAGSASVSEGGRIEDLHATVASGIRFGTVYADPPWLYDNQGTRAATGNHYGGMTVDELCALPIDQLMLPDGHLHLWTTNGFLFECPRIFAAWGFEFRSSFIWVKPKIGIGNYWRNSHEFLLTAIRGDAKRFEDHSLTSWLECDRGQHSAKPEQVRSFIERASPGPYLELFGRREAERWTVWGNEVRRELFDRREIIAEPVR